MLTRQQLQPLFHVYRLFTKIGFYPISLHFETGELRSTKSRTRWILWWGFLSIVTCRAIFGTLRCLSIFASSTKVPPGEVPFVLNQLLYWLAVFAYPMLFYKNLDVKICVFNSLLQGPVRKKPWRNLTLQEMVVLLVLPVDVFVISGIFVAVLILQPMAAYNFFSAINPKWQTAPVLLAIALTEGSISLYVFAGLTITTHVILLFFQKCIEETQSMLKIVGRRHIRNDSLDILPIQHTLKDLRRLQLLILVYNGGYKYMHFLAKFLALFWYIVTISFGIVAIDSSPLMSYAYFFFGIQFASIYCIVFHKAFSIPTLTKKVKSKLLSVVKTTTNGNIRSEYEKWIRSIPPIGIKVGGFHLFERMSTPNFLAFGIKNITRTVIAYRSK